MDGSDLTEAEVKDLVSKMTTDGKILILSNWKDNYETGFLDGRKRDVLRAIKRIESEYYDKYKYVEGFLHAQLSANEKVLKLFFN